MFNNLGIHFIQYPTGRFGFVGTLPYELGSEVKASGDDIRAGRFTTKNEDGETVTIKFPTFETIQEAINHADARGVSYCISTSCACMKLRQ